MVKSPWFSRTTGPKIMQLGSAGRLCRKQVTPRHLMLFFCGGGGVVLLVFGFAASGKNSFLMQDYSKILRREKKHLKIAKGIFFLSGFWGTPVLPNQGQ